MQNHPLTQLETQLRSIYLEYNDRDYNTIPKVSETVQDEDYDTKIQDILHFNLPPFFHTRDFIELIYVYQGNIKLFLPENEYLLKTGDLCFLGPDTTHTITVFDDNISAVKIFIRISIFESSFSHILRRKDIVGNFFTYLVYNRYSGDTNPFMIFSTEGQKDVLVIINNMYSENCDAAGLS